MTPEEVRAAVRSVVNVLPVRVANLTACDPDCDPTGAMLSVALDLMVGLLDAMAHTK